MKARRRLFGTPRNKRGTLLSFLPRTVTATLYYTDDDELPLIALAENAQKITEYSVNGCFDPDLTGIGHQPRMFDQYMSFYLKYEVLASRIKVKFFAPTTQHQPVWIGLYAAQSDAIIQANADMVVLQVANPKTTFHSRMAAMGLPMKRYWCHNIANNKEKFQTWTTAWSQKKSIKRTLLEGTAGDAQDIVQWQAQAGNNPVLPVGAPYLEKFQLVSCANLGGVLGLATPVLEYTVTIEYRVKFSDPKSSGTS